MPQTDTKLTVRFKRGGRIKERHGGYSYLHGGKLPRNRKHVLRCLIAARAGLVKDLGPAEEALTTSQILLVDKLINLLGVTRCMEEYAKEKGVMKGGHLLPCLQKQYLAYVNSARLILVTLGLDKSADKRALSPIEVLTLEDKERERVNDDNPGVE